MLSADADEPWGEPWCRRRPGAHRLDFTIPFLKISKNIGLWDMIGQKRPKKGLFLYVSIFMVLVLKCISPACFR